MNEFQLHPSRLQKSIQPALQHVSLAVAKAAANAVPVSGKGALSLFPLCGGTSATGAKHDIQ